MGCDIHCFAEMKVDGKYFINKEYFHYRDYGLFGWLAGVRNYSDVPTLAEPRGVPKDLSKDVNNIVNDWNGDGHSHSWFYLVELTEFNYDNIVEDRRYTEKIGENFYNGGATCEPGKGNKMTYREFLGSEYFKNLEEMKSEGVDRIVFFFDN